MFISIMTSNLRFKISNIKDQIGRVDFEKLRKMTMDLASALLVLKLEGIVHCDLKPENIFIESRFWTDRQTINWKTLPDDAVIKVGDFGISCHITEVSKLFNDFSVQSMPYRSPEVLFGVPFNQQIDVWSIGVILVELCIGKTLFRAQTHSELYLEYAQKVSRPSSIRFAGGKFSDRFVQSNDFPKLENGIEESPLDFAVHLKAIKTLLSEVPNTPPSFVHLVAGLLHPDPECRLTPSNMVRHHFISSSIGIPTSLVVGSQINRLAELNSSINILRRKRKRKLEN